LASIAGGIRPVEIKSEVRQVDIAYQTARSLVSRQRTAQGNHIRGLLAEFGIAVRTGFKPLREKLCELTDVGSTLAPRLKSLLADEYEHLCELDQRLEWHDREVKRTAKESVRCQALIEMPGIGPVVSVALVNWFGDATQYKRGRDAAAALGLVPSQHSSGGKSRLGKISKRGDSFTRCQIVHGARAAVRAATNKNDNLSRWIQALVARRGVNKATVALANKLVRIAWAILATGCCYEQRLAAKA
jgi:transposase